MDCFNDGCESSETDSTNETVELLLDADADVNLVNKDGKTAIDMVSNNWSPILKKYILERNKFKKECLDLRVSG